MATIIKKNHLGGSKLVQLIQTLTPKELRELKNWLASPWSKNSKYYLPFYKIIAKAAPSFTSDTLIKKRVYKSLYGEGPYQEGIFNNLIRALTKEVQQYLAMLQTQQSGEDCQQLLRKHLLERNAISQYEEATKDKIRQLDQLAGKSAQDYLHLNQLHQAIYFQASGTYRYQKEAPNLVKTNAALDAFYLLEKYKYGYEAISRAQILKIPKENSWAVALSELHTLQSKLALEAVSLYQLRIQRKGTLSWELYQQFKDTYLAAFPNLSLELQQSFLVFCINDVVQLDRKGHLLALEESFFWYELGLHNNLLLEQGYLSWAAINNIILTACHLDKLPFLRTFIPKYKKKIPKTIRKDACKWIESQLDLVEGNYEKIVETFLTWLPKNKPYVIQAKITLLKAHTKLALDNTSYINIFETGCQAFERYIRRNELYTKDKNRSYLKFVKYAKKIVTNKHDTLFHRDWKILENAIEEESVITGKQWLLREISLLKNMGE